MVHWRKSFFNNDARPRACFTLWLACHDKLATNDKLHRFGMIDDDICGFCDQRDTIQHLLFDYTLTKRIWQYVLRWLHIQRSPSGWHEELSGIISTCKGKGSKALPSKRISPTDLQKLEP